jgi:hypothetical protein
MQGGGSVLFIGITLGLLCVVSWILNIYLGYRLWEWAKEYSALKEEYNTINKSVLELLADIDEDDNVTVDAMRRSVKQVSRIRMKYITLQNRLCLYEASQPLTRNDKVIQDID